MALKCFMDFFLFSFSLIRAYCVVDRKYAPFPGYRARSEESIWEGWKRDRNLICGMTSAERVNQISTTDVDQYFWKAGIDEWLGFVYDFMTDGNFLSIEFNFMNNPCPYRYSTTLLRLHLWIPTGNKTGLVSVHCLVILFFYLLSIYSAL